MSELNPDLLPFTLWQKQVIELLTDVLDLVSQRAAADYFERHRQACEVSWSQGLDVITAVECIVEAECAVAEIRACEAKEKLRSTEPTYFELEADLIEAWRQDCIDNGLI